MIKKIINSLMIILLLLINIMPFHYVSAANDYTEVLEDLQVDANFNVNDYPSMLYKQLDYFNNDEDTTNDQPEIEIIQIGESTNGNLYIYTYQPTFGDVNFKALSLSMSLVREENGDGIKPHNYDLKLLSQDGVFCKYLVKDFKILEDEYRYYNIVCIRREYMADIDDLPLGSDSNGYEKAIDVGQKWCVYTNDKDELVYEKGTFETMEIEYTAMGNIYFSNGFNLLTISVGFSKGNSWYIGFNCKDYIIEKIYDATLSYKTRRLTTHSDGTGSSGEWSEVFYKDLDEDDVMEYQGDGLFAPKFVWNRIMTGKSYLDIISQQGISMSTEQADSLYETQFVFSFLETQSTSVNNGFLITTESTDVGHVSVLRIHFIDVNQNEYNLGVVSDRVNPDNIPDGFGGIGDGVDDDKDMLKIILMILGLLCLCVLLSVFAPVLSLIFGVLTTCLKFMFTALLNVISLPFKLIGSLFKTNKRKR